MESGARKRSAVSSSSGRRNVSRHGQGSQSSAAVVVSWGETVNFEMWVARTQAQFSLLRVLQSSRMIFKRRRKNPDRFLFGSETDGASSVLSRLHCESTCWKTDRKCLECAVTYQLHHEERGFQIPSTAAGHRQMAAAPPNLPLVVPVEYGARQPNPLRFLFYLLQGGNLTHIPEHVFSAPVRRLLKVFKFCS